LMADTDDCIPGYQKLVDAVRPHGTTLFGQLFHDGREMMESQDGSLPVALAPSAVPNERFHVMPRAMPVITFRAPGVVPPIRLFAAPWPEISIPLSPMPMAAFPVESVPM